MNMWTCVERKKLELYDLVRFEYRSNAVYTTDLNVTNERSNTKHADEYEYIFSMTERPPFSTSHLPLRLLHPPLHLTGSPHFLSRIDIAQQPQYQTPINPKIP